MQTFEDVLVDLIDNPTEAARALDVRALPTGTLIFYWDSPAGSPNHGNTGQIIRTTEVSYIVLGVTKDSRNAYLRRSPRMLDQRGVKALATGDEYAEIALHFGKEPRWSSPSRPARRTPTTNDTLAARYAAGQEAYKALAEIHPEDYDRLLTAALAKRGITVKED